MRHIPTHGAHGRPARPLTVLQWTIALVVFGIALGAWTRFTRRHDSAVGGKLSEASCIGCGWKGRVSKYHRQCPKCGNAITKTSRG